MGYRASTTSPENWSTFENALRAAQRPGFAQGVGFVFTANDPYCGIDLDHVWQSDADEGAEWAHGILERFRNTYLEESPSGSGVKIWCKAKAPRCGSWPVGVGAIEIYDRARFFAFTGRSNGVLLISDHQADIEALVANLNEGRSLTSAPTVSARIPHGARHNALISLAGTMWRRGMCVESIHSALLEVNQRQCDPPGEPEHIAGIIASMQRWPR
jgi:hypothetical protein